MSCSSFVSPPSCWTGKCSEMCGAACHNRGGRRWQRKAVSCPLGDDHHANRASHFCDITLTKTSLRVSIGAMWPFAKASGNGIYADRHSTVWGLCPYKGFDHSNTPHLVLKFNNSPSKVQQPPLPVPQPPQLLPGVVPSGELSGPSPACFPTSLQLQYHFWLRYLLHQNVWQKKTKPELGLRRAHFRAR